MKALKSMIIDNAAFFDTQMNEIKLKMFAHELADLPLQMVATAFEHFRRERGRRQMPMPSDIKAFVNREADPRALGLEAASRAVAAVSKFGWCNAGAAREWIGELGWRAVERLGGWQYFCENLGVTIQVTTAQAQIRDLCESTVKLGDVGIHDQPIGLPERSKDDFRGLTPVSDVIKGFLPKKDEDEK